MKKDSLLVKSGRKFTEYQGSMNPPIYRASTILFPKFSDYTRAKSGINVFDDNTGNIPRDYSYSSVGTPTVHYLEKALAEIEGRGNALIFPSGLLALTLSAQAFLYSGSHILVPDNMYYRFKRFASENLTSIGIDVTFYNPTQSIEHLIRKDTAVIMIDSPASATFEITDIRPIVEIAKKNNIITIFDNSWATSLFFKPLDHGIDVAVYAVTKYINGHSDILMGAILAEGEIFAKLYNTYRNFGVSVSPDDCYLAHRGLRTLHVRLDHHYRNALAVAQWLEKHEKVERVLYPALSSHPQHELWKRDFSGATGLFSIILKDNYSDIELEQMLDNLKVFGIGASWGGCDSLILPMDLHSIRTSAMPPYHGNCLRIFCGLEDSEDLIADLELALSKLPIKSSAEASTRELASGSAY